MAYEVTIGIPVYNVEKYIRQTLECILGQTFESIEYVFCDDCGTDKSVAIIEEIKSQHPRGSDIRILRQPKNMGVGCARNRIVEEAKGRYLYFMDSDDMIAPNTIEVMYQNARKYEAEIVYGSMDKIFVYKGGEVFHYRSYPDVQFLKEDEFANYVFRKYDGIQGSTCNFLIDINVYSKYGLKYKPINYWEDFSFTFDLPTHVKRVVLLPDVTYFYMCRADTLSNYQERDIIAKDEILDTMMAINELKVGTDRLRGKPYFAKRCYKLMMTCFYICCTILRNETIIHPSFSRKEIRDLMKSPLTLVDTLRLKDRKIENLFLYMLGVIPAWLTVSCIRLLGKKKGLV
ncbi:MAG: glycosyltransferase family 2 protein [Prevotella sp.]|nr:glycosyltransferase family 2 protein [Prevotella sp.]